jgi:hypothetical protein
MGYLSSNMTDLCLPSTRIRSWAWISWLKFCMDSLSPSRPEYNQKKKSNELNLHLLRIWSLAAIMSLFITWYINSIADIASKNNINTVLNITFYLWMVVSKFYGFMCWNCLVSGYEIFVACLWHNYSSFPQINPSRTYPAYAISYLTCPLGHPQIYLFPVLVYFFFTTMLNMLNHG